MKCVMTMTVVGMTVLSSGCGRVSIFSENSGASQKHQDPKPVVAQHEGKTAIRKMGPTAKAFGRVATSASTTRQPLPIAGIWVPSGWMGDAESPNGAIDRELCDVAPHSPPTCEKWIYGSPRPGERGWAAVAYQSPDGNFGSKRAPSLAGKGYTRVSFWIRSGSPQGARVIFKSGGHTQLQSRWPASYATMGKTIRVTDEWKRHSIPLEDFSGKPHDLSAVPCALCLVFLRALNPSGCHLFIDSIQFD